MHRKLTVLSVCFLATVAAAAPEAVTLSAGKATARVAPDGTVTSLRVYAGNEDMIRPHPAMSAPPVAFVAVEDLRSHRTYSVLTDKSTITGWKAEADGGKSVGFVQQYEGAPFAIAHRISETPAGVRWEASLRLAEGETLNRSVRVNWMLPLPFGWRFWGPNSLEARRTNGVDPFRFVYGHTNRAPYGLVIPLVGVWGGRGGAAVFSPPDVRKCQILFDVLTQTIADPPRGVIRQREDLQHLRVSHDMVGLRPGKELKLAVCIAGVRPDWRGVLGHYVAAYPELFEPVPAARKYEGMYGITSPSRGDVQHLDRLVPHRVRSLEVHGHFPEYGIYVTREALADPTLTWRCKPHPGPDRSLEINRLTIREALQRDIPPFMYFYNVHANRQTIDKLWPEDLMKMESGEVGVQYRGEPPLRAIPESGFGKHLIEQMDLMIQAYPDAPGFFVDNFTQEWVSFAHDDGVTMVHNRPAYDMNRNHQVIGPICFAKAHKAGKVIMVNKLATIESARGADMVLVEHMDPDGLQMHAFACVYRAVFPLSWGDGRRESSLEQGLKLLLLWGGTPAETISRAGPETLRAYRPLTDAMIGKRWVFDADPLRVPSGLEGQIFRIDPHAPHAGDVVVTLTHPDRSWRDEARTEGLTVRVRLPEAAELTQATFLAPGEDAKPVPCKIDREGDTLSVNLPPMGAAGVLRLSR
ncbi:MAG TPA: hypothetical protein VFJ30_06075 [Phycisphaerae bacterium]|nr:hypothetical protein [Phycisphaerae bacterium]